MTEFALHMLFEISMEIRDHIITILNFDSVNQTIKGF